ncbi:MAG: ABC transporter substrate-binding protein [Thermodesulfobacteriota bacterium]
MKRIITLVAALAGLVGPALCGPQDARAKEPLKVGYSDWPGFTSWQIGKEKGIFARNGVDVELVWFPVYTDSLTALNTGKLDGNLQTWSDTMAPLAEGIPLKVVLILDNSFGNDAIVARPGIDSVKDLKSKTVGTELATVDHFMLLNALAANGMTEADVEYTNLTVQDAAAAFIAGKLDAAAIWQPWIAQIQREGKGKVIYSSADMPGLIPDLAVFQAKVVEERPADVQAAVKSFFEIVDFIRTNEDEAVAIMAKVVEQPPADYKAFLPGTKFFDLEANLKGFEKRDDDASLHGSGKTITEFLKKMDQIETIPDYGAALEPKFVRALGK